MNIFDKLGSSSGSGSGDALRPLSRDRVERGLDHWGMKYKIDGDGDVGALYNGHLYFFLVAGGNKTVLLIRGIWNSTLDGSRRGAVLETLNEWHRGKMWPKGYIQPADAGRIRVDAEVIVDLEHGATDAQIAQFIIGALATTDSLFNHLQEQFPEAQKIV